jgi:arylsulfatase A-like enzyme
VDPAKHGTTDSRHAELVDIVPTIMDAIGQRIPDELPGESILKEGMRLGGFAEFHSHGYDDVLHAPAYMWRTRDWKLILSFDGNLDQARRDPGGVKGELYHLTSDPMEWDNLYDREEHLRVREQMTRDLLYQLAINWSHFPRYDAHAWSRPNPGP